MFMFVFVFVFVYLLPVQSSSRVLPISHINVQFVSTHTLYVFHSHDSVICIGIRRAFRFTNLQLSEGARAEVTTSGLRERAACVCTVSYRTSQ